MNNFLRFWVVCTNYFEQMCGVSLRAEAEKGLQLIRDERPAGENGGIGGIKFLHQI
jgi:hypothetical protein